MGSRHYLGEQTVAIRSADIEPQVAILITAIHQDLERRIPNPEPVRLPHATLTPTISFGYFTFWAQSQAHASDLPMANLVYREYVHKLKSAIDGRVLVRRADWTETLFPAAMRLRAWIRATAWKEYEKLVADELHP
jgi:hypothetical protein